MKKIDLHVHSNYSDGTFSPKELVDLAVKKNLSAFALTDHDSVNGVEEILNYNASISSPVEIVPGIELSTEYNKHEIHIVGLYVNHKDDNLIKTAGYYADLREHRNELMVENFRKAGINMTIEDLQDGNDDTVITRAHFAKYLIEHNVVKDAKEAFSTMLGEDSPYYVPRKRMDSMEAIKLINDASGIAVLAHPIHYHLSENELINMVKDMKDHGLVGIEVKYSNHSKQDEYFVSKLANTFSLLPSGGSDFHGSNKPQIDLGSGRGNLSIPYEYLENFKKYLYE